MGGFKDQGSTGEHSKNATVPPVGSRGVKRTSSDLSRSAARTKNATGPLPVPVALCQRPQCVRRSSVERFGAQAGSAGSYAQGEGVDHRACASFLKRCCQSSGRNPECQRPRRTATTFGAFTGAKGPCIRLALRRWGQWNGCGGARDCVRRARDQVPRFRDGVKRYRSTMTHAATLAPTAHWRQAVASLASSHLSALPSPPMLL